MSNKTTFIPLTELDKQSFQGASQMLKAAVTYMDPSSGKMLAMLARLLELKQTRAQISDEIGFSVKTLERSIQKLEELDLIRVQRGKIIITQDGYRRMKDHIEHHING